MNDDLKRLHYLSNVAQDNEIIVLSYPRKGCTNENKYRISIYEKTLRERDINFQELS